MKWLIKLPKMLFSPMVRGLAPVFATIRAGWIAGPVRGARQIGKFFSLSFWAVVHWCAGLNLRLFLQGLPALVVGASCLSVLAYAAVTPTQEIEIRYSEKAQAARKAKDYPEALACYERLAEMQGDRQDVLFEWAMTAQAAGQPDKCLVLMNHLASPDKPGYAKAHLWQAVRLMSNPNVTRQMRQLAESHLLRAVAGHVDDKEAAHGLLGELYFTRGDYDKAEAAFLIAVKTKLQVRIRLAHLYAIQGNPVRAQAEAKIAANLYSTAAKADLFNHYARVCWADCTAFLEEFPQAIQILEEGLSGTNEDLYKEALARTYAAWFDHLGRQRQGLTGERLKLLEIGLSYDPKNLPLLERLLGVTGTKHFRPITPDLVAATVGLAEFATPLGVLDLWFSHKVAEAETASATLRRLLATGQGTPQVNFALGVDAWDRGDVKAARYYWEQAVEDKKSGIIPTIANNLAWLLLQTSPGELDKALELMNLAIEKAPNETNFRDTRGHILIKMGKKKEAITDLQMALGNSPNPVELHRLLAELYDPIDPKTAFIHRRFAAEKAARKVSPR